MIGNAHIDPVWMWRWQEGYAEVMATFSSALDRLNESSDIYFNCSSAAYYKWVEEANPQMFEEIRQRIAEGRWVIVGGWWIQPDCNLPSGESFVRHALYAQRYFLSKFGYICKTGYNVDSFGHSAALPQILKKSGMDSYVMMRPSPEENPELPYLFWWQSPDGSKVLTYKIPFSYNDSYLSYSDDNSHRNFPNDGNSRNYSGNESFINQPEGKNPMAIKPLERKIRAASILADQNNIDMMCFFGIGNHGGGPTKKSIALIGKLIEESNLAESNLPEIVFSTPDRYFKDVLERYTKIPLWEKDLLHHSTGCYSSHSGIKKNNRYAENRLIQAEKFAALASNLFGAPYPENEIGRAWENILFNQFHDIMGGCSIKSSYEDADELHGEALSIGAKILNKAVQKISWNINTIPQSFQDEVIGGKTGSRLWDINDHGAPIILFNSLSWDVTVPVRLDKSVKSIRDDQGNILPRQEIQCERTHKNEFVDNIFFAKIPAFGYSTYWGFTNVTANLEPLKKTVAGKTYSAGIHDYLGKDSNVYQNKASDVYQGKASDDYLGKDPDEYHDEKFSEYYGRCHNRYYMENEFVRVEFNNDGYIASIYDKKMKINAFGSPAAVPVIIDDKGDAWGHNIVKYRDEIGRIKSYEMKIVEEGPLLSCIRVKSRYGKSEIWQDFMLYPGSMDVFVDVRLDWHEKCKMLKLSFPINNNIKECIASYEIPYGYINREINGEEMPGQSWIDVTGETGCGEYGVAIANDSKYAYDIDGNEMRLTVARSPVFAWHFTRTLEPDKDYEYIDEGIQTFKYMIIPHSGGWQDAGVVKKSWELNNPPFIVYETYHKGIAPRTASIINISRENIIASVFKKAEDSEDYILRCYETAGIKTEVEIGLSITDENCKKWTAVFNINEIKTFLIPHDGSEIKEVNLIELEGGNIDDLYQT